MLAAAVETVDSQVHIWVPPTEEFPWDERGTRGVPDWYKRLLADSPVSAEKMIEMMDAVGVDAAILTELPIYGADCAYSLDAARRHAPRFGVVAPVRTDTPGVAERVRTFRDEPHALGVRVVRFPDNPEPIGSAGHRAIFTAAEAGNVPVFVVATGLLRELAEIARDFPSLQIVLDALGISAPDWSIDEQLAQVPDLVALARFENVAVKCHNAPRFSREPYPFADLWPLLHEVIDAFGVERVMWASDITVHPDISYEHAVDYLRSTDRLSDSDKEQILGASARTLLRWPVVQRR
jgi:predicted TIM-barrel fold metal-dependent hydrolase